jgi:hypothetical protein
LSPYKHAVEAPLRTDIEALIGQDRHNLPRRQRRKLRLVAGEQDPLPFFFCEAMGNHPMAAFTAIHAVPADWADSSDDGHPL